jgi:hypothetical protein
MFTVVSPARSPAPHSLHLDAGPRTFNPNMNNADCSNSSWAEMESFVIGSFRMYPLTWSTKVIYILRYLAPMGQYQEVKKIYYILSYNSGNFFFFFFFFQITKGSFGYSNGHLCEVLYWSKQIIQVMPVLYFCCIV